MLASLKFSKISHVDQFNYLYLEEKMILMNNSASIPSPQDLQNANKYVTFSQHVRGPANAPMPQSHGNWKAAKKKDADEIAEINDPLGFRARLYTDNSEYVIAFRGTQSLEELFLMDSQIAIGLLPDVYSQIDTLLKNIPQGTPPDKIKFIGHSLGATLASAMSSDFGYEAWVYESPGVPGYSAEQLGNVHAFQSATPDVVNSLPYAKALDKNLFNIPLPAKVVQDILTRNNYMLRLNAENIVTNDATRAIRVVADITNQTMTLLDIHSIDTMSTALQELQALIYPEDLSSGKKSGSYSLEVLLHTQQALAYSKKLIDTNQSSETSKETDFIANKNAAWRAVSDAEKSIDIYKNCYLIEENSPEDKLLKETSKQLNNLKNQLAKAKTVDDLEKVEKNITKTNKELQKLINGQAQEVSLKSITNSAFETISLLDKETAKLGMDILVAFGLKISPEDRAFTETSLAMIGALAKNYQISKSPDSEGSFFADSLVTLNEYFVKLSALGESSEYANIAKVGSIGINAITIVKELNVLIKMETIGLAAINPVALIAVSAISIFSVLSRGSSKSKAEAEAEALRYISQQIADLHQYVAEAFDQVFENQRKMMEALSRAFSEVEANFKVPVMKGLASIQQSILDLRYEINISFRELFLSAFTALVQQADRLTEGHFDSDVKYKSEKILSTTAKLLGWIKEQSEQPLITGLIHKLPHEKKAALQQINTLLSENDLDSVLGYFILFLEKFYPLELGFTVNANEIANINTWTLAVSNYLKLLEIDGTLLRNYSLEQLQSIYRKATAFLKFIDHLRTNEGLQNAISQDYLGILENVIASTQTQFLISGSRDRKTNAANFSTLFPLDSGIEKNVLELGNALNGQLQIIKALSDLAGLTENIPSKSPNLMTLESLQASNIQRYFAESSSQLSIQAPQILATHTITFYVDGNPKIAVLVQDNAGTRVNIYDPKTQTSKIGQLAEGYKYHNASVQAFIPYTKKNENQKNHSKLYAILLDTNSKQVLALAEYDLEKDAWTFHKQLNLPEPIFWNRQQPSTNLSTGIIIGSYLINEKPLEAFCFNDLNQITVVAMLGKKVMKLSAESKDAIHLTGYTFDLNNIRETPKKINSVTLLSAVENIGGHIHLLRATLSAAQGEKDLYFFNMSFAAPGFPSQALSFKMDVTTGNIQHLNNAAIPRYDGASYSPLKLLVAKVNGEETLFTLANPIANFGSTTSQGMQMFCYDSKNNWQGLHGVPDNISPIVNSVGYPLSEARLVNVANVPYIAFIHQNNELNIWLYNINEKRWLRNQEQVQYCVPGPEWPHRIATSGMIHITTSDNFFDRDPQTLMTFIRCMATSIEIQNFSLAPSAAQLSNNPLQTLQNWQRDMRDTKPRLVTLSSTNPQDNDTTSLYVETIPTIHKEYGFSALGIRPAQMKNINLENQQATLELLGKEISLVLQAAYLNRNTSADRNFWRWLITSETSQLISDAELYLKTMHKTTKDLELVYEKIIREANLFEKDNNTFSKRDKIINPNDVKDRDSHDMLIYIYDYRTAELMKWLKDTSNNEPSMKQQKESWAKELETAQENNKKTTNEFEEFCSNQKICQLYLTQGLTEDLPLGWRSATAYLQQSPDNLIFISKIDLEKDTFTNLAWYGDLDTSEIIFHIVPSNDDYSFNLLRSTEDIDPSLLPPKSSSRFDASLRSTAFSLQRAIHSSEESKITCVEQNSGINSTNSITRKKLITVFNRAILSDKTKATLPNKESMQPPFEIKHNSSFGF